MLILTRRIGESVRVGDVIITFLAGRGESVKVGFEGPKDVAIVRMEIEEEHDAPE